jgi:hypothetical protein
VIYAQHGAASILTRGLETFKEIEGGLMLLLNCQTKLISFVRVKTLLHQIEEPINLIL